MMRRSSEHETWRRGDVSGSGGGDGGGGGSGDGDGGDDDDEGRSSRRSDLYHMLILDHYHHFSKSSWS